MVAANRIGSGGTVQALWKPTVSVLLDTAIRHAQFLPNNDPVVQQMAAAGEDHATVAGVVRWLSAGPRQEQLIESFAEWFEFRRAHGRSIGTIDAATISRQLQSLQQRSEG